MQRIVNAARPVAVPAPDVEIASWSAPWSRLLPLWRHAAWLLCLFSAFAIAAGVRLDVQRTLKEIDRNQAMQREARVLNERLKLEIDARRRAVAVERLAADLGMNASAPLVRIPEGR